MPITPYQPQSGGLQNSKALKIALSAVTGGLGGAALGTIGANNPTAGAVASLFSKSPQGGSAIDRYMQSKIADPPADPGVDLGADALAPFQYKSPYSQDAMTRRMSLGVGI